MLLLRRDCLDTNLIGCILVAEKLENVRSSVNRLSEEATRLAESLSAAAQALESDGLLPSRNLSSELSAFQHRHEALRSTVDRVLIDGGSDVRLPANNPTLSDILAAVDALEAHERALEAARMTRKSALNVLDTVARIRHLDDAGFPALEALHAKAAAVREQVAQEHGETVSVVAQELADGRHSICDLHTLMMHADDLADDEWARCHDRVAAEFGRQLATAAARNKLR